MKRFLLQIVRLLQDYTAKPLFMDSRLLLNHFATFILQYKYLLFRKFDRSFRIVNYSLKSNEKTI